MKNENNILYLSKFLESITIESSLYFDKLISLSKEGKEKTMECKNVIEILIGKLDFTIKTCNLILDYCKLNDQNPEMTEKMEKYIAKLLSQKKDLLSIRI